MTTIKEIFTEYAPEYIGKYEHSMPKNHLKAINAILNCKSEENGTTTFRCNKCEKKHTVYKSCGNRHCPSCQYSKSLKWIEKQLARQVPGRYFMITFTVPEQLRPIFRSNQESLYKILFKAASTALKVLAKDPRFIGVDMIGATAVLHTWGKLIQYHPHIHFIVPGGGFTADKKNGSHQKKIFLCMSNHFL